MKAVEAENVAFAYSNGISIINGLNLEAEAGTIYGLLGANGAGKTTTIKLLTGQVKPSFGSVRIFGEDPFNNSAIRTRIGLMQEDGGHYDRLTVEANLKFFCKLYGVSSKRSKDLLELVGLSDKARAKAGILSKGQKQRLALARCLIGEPQLIFLDEPTSGLDPMAAHKVRTLIDELCSKGNTIFLTTHYLEEAEQLCHNIGILKDGQLVCQGNPIDLCHKYLPESVEVKVSGRIITRPPGLEELFLAVAGQKIFDE